jgi:hypothetical protein
MDYREAMQILRAAQLQAPSIVRPAGSTTFYIFSRTKQVCHGGSIKDALEAGGFLPAPHPPAPFVAEYMEVRWKGAEVCTARSASMARRIANALNEYAPDPKRAY